MIEKIKEQLLNIEISDRDGKVCIDFGTPLVWLSLSPADAFAFAKAVTARAELMLLPLSASPSALPTPSSSARNSPPRRKK